MARQGRYNLAGIAQHVVQRARVGSDCFRDDDDRRAYLRELGAAALRFGCAIHAYVLMPDHVHLLATPRDDTGVPRMMQALGRRYVAHFNRRHGASGPLWRRYVAALIADGPHVLACCRHIEAHPVRAGLAARARDWAWSSHACSGSGAEDACVTLHPEHARLGGDAQASAAAWRRYVDAGADPRETLELRLHTRQQRAWGNREFRRDVESRSARVATARPRGRPRAAWRAPRT
jgi:putative transposase